VINTLQVSKYRPKVQIRVRSTGTGVVHRPIEVLEKVQPLDMSRLSIGINPAAGHFLSPAVPIHHPNPYVAYSRQAVQNPGAVVGLCELEEGVGEEGSGLELGVVEGLQEVGKVLAVAFRLGLEGSEDGGKGSVSETSS